jgi:hypothetical protein
LQPDVGHIDLIDQLAAADNQMFQRIIDWLQ